MYAIGGWLGTGHHIKDKVILMAIGVVGGDGAGAEGMLSRL